jgi:hypothetical protein
VLQSCGLAVLQSFGIAVLLSCGPAVEKESEGLGLHQARYLQINERW